MAAAAASSLRLRARQSRSPRAASRSSAAWLDNRSSCSTTRRPVRVSSARPNASTRAVWCVGTPSRRRGHPTTTAARPSSSRRKCVDDLGEHPQGFGFGRRALEQAPGRSERAGGVTQRQPDAARAVVDAQNPHSASIRCAGVSRLGLAGARCWPPRPAAPASAPTRQLVLLAVDGLDPEILSHLIADGRVAAPGRVGPRIAASCA